MSDSVVRRCSSPRSSGSLYRPSLVYAMCVMVCVLLLGVVFGPTSCEGQVTLQSATAYVRNTPLASPKTTGSVGATPPPPTWTNSSKVETQGIVVQGSVCAAGSTAIALHKESWALSQLFAQLAATYVIDPFDNTKLWYQTYVKTLSEIGWAIDTLNFTQQSQEGSQFQISVNLETILGALAIGDEALVFTSLMGSLQSDATGAYNLFESHATDQSAGVFQASVVTTDDDGQISVGISASYYTASQSQKHILWVDWSQYSLGWFASATTTHVVDSVFPIDELRERLKDFIQTAATTIPLATPTQ